MRRRLILGATALLAAFAASVFWAGDYLTRPSRTGTGIPDRDLHARPLVFDSLSGLKPSTWFVPGAPVDGAILLLHGLRSNKQAMLPRARFLNALGFSVLMVDLQAHGESEGERVSFGHRESADVGASVRKLHELAPGERIGILGTSLGAAAAVFSDVQPLLSAVVLEALYPGIEEAVASRLRNRFGTPGTWLSPLLLAQLGPRLGVAPAQLRPIDRVALLRCPTLLLHGSEDRHTTIEEARRIFDALPALREFHVLPGAAHVDLHEFGGKAYEQRVGDFLRRHLRSAR